MEPMALGSPAGSPTQALSSSPGTNSGYLPGFLLGDTNQQSRMGMMTPDASRFAPPGHISTSSPMLGYSTPDLRINRQKAMFGGSTNTPISQINTENHVGGPPTRSLYESLDAKQSLGMSNNMSMNANNQSRVLGGGFANNTMSSPYNETPLNMTQNESTQGLLQWITVFGFPSSALNCVLSHISSRVRIIDKHPAPHSQSNWIHLKCASEQEAQRSLSCNGNIVSGSIMIGVTPCTDEGVVLGNNKENCTRINESMKLFSTPNRPMGFNGQRTPVRISNARPLVSGYNQHLSPQAVRSPDNIPHKSTGLVTKAMEYVFGW